MHPLALFALPYYSALMGVYATQTAVGLTLYAWSPGPYTSESNVVPLRRKEVS